MIRNLSAAAIGVAMCLLVWSGSALGQSGETPDVVVGTGFDVGAWAVDRYGVPAALFLLLWRIGGNLGKIPGIPVAVQPIEHVHRLHPETAAEVATWVVRREEPSEEPVADRPRPKVVARPIR